MEPTIRRIQPTDDPQVAVLIREVMAEFSCVGEGYSREDPEVDAMFDAYSNPRCAFWVVEQHGQILGCGGIAPLLAGDPCVCELRKMYFRQALRGLGFGKKLLTLCLEWARENEFTGCYFETVERMTTASKLYRHFGFQELDQPMGKTGHSGCDRWCYLELQQNTAKPV